MIVDRHTPEKRKIFELEVSNLGDRVQRCSLPGKFELTIGRSLAGDRIQNSAVDVEHLDTMIIRIGDDHAIRIRHGDVVRMLELANFVAERTEFAHERTVRLENLREKITAILKNYVKFTGKFNTGIDLYSMILFIANVNESESVGCDAPWIVESSVGRSLATECAQETSRRI